MSELTPAEIDAQEVAKAKLRALRRESETFFERRDAEILAADKTGLSLRDIGREIGMSPQGVSNVLKRVRGEQ